MAIDKTTARRSTCSSIEKVTLMSAATATLQMSAAAAYNVAVRSIDQSTEPRHKARSTSSSLLADNKDATVLLCRKRRQSDIRYTMPQPTFVPGDPSAIKAGSEIFISKEVKAPAENRRITPKYRKINSREARRYANLMESLCGRKGRVVSADGRLW
jgi:hypothetical protein